MIQLQRSLVCSLFALAAGCQSHHRLPEDRKVGLSSSEVVVGMTAAMTGSASFLGTQTAHGAQAWFNEVNRTGGVAGRQIRLVVRDDGYDPPRTGVNVQALLVEDHAFALFGFVGTPTSVRATPLIDRAKVPSVGFFTGAEALRKPTIPWAFHVRDSYYAEAEHAVAYFIDELKLERVAVLYQQDAFGQAVLSGLQLALKRRNKVPAALATYERGSLAMEGPLSQLQPSKPEAYFMVGTYAPLARFVKLASSGGEHPWFHTVSFVGSEAFATELTQAQKLEPAHYAHVLVTQVVPSPRDDKLPGVMEYRALHARAYPSDSPNYVALEGFINAKVLTLALTRAGHELDRDKLVSALESLSNLDIGIGRKLSYSPTNHVALTGVFLSRLEPDGIFRTF